LERLGEFRKRMLKSSSECKNCGYPTKLNNEGFAKEIVGFPLQYIIVFHCTNCKYNLSAIFIVKETNSKETDQGVFFNN